MDAISYSYADKQAKRIKKFINDPDSTSGVLTVPKVIASGENITIPSGRVAVLPNVQVDGTLNVQGDVFIPSGATTADLDNRIALKADTTYVNTQLSNKANTADLKEIGVGQTWQDVTASRSLGVTYTNSTGKPIIVGVYFIATIAGQRLRATINGFSFFINNGAGSNATYQGGSILVPNGATYSLVNVDGGASSAVFYELR